KKKTPETLSIYCNQVKRKMSRKRPHEQSPPYAGHGTGANSKRCKTDMEVRSSCQQCEHKQSLTEMETFYKEKLNEARSALKQKEEELKSFKQR
ncbi:hypothetical protein AMECASPLE_035651, partial [Ameca splendens]